MLDFESNVTIFPTYTFKHTFDDMWVASIKFYFFTLTTESRSLVANLLSTLREVVLAERLVDAATAF